MADAGMLTRVMSVLACFTEDTPDVSAADIVAATGLPASTVHRLVADLVGRGLLARAPGRRYTIGGRLWELGELSPRRRTLVKMLGNMDTYVVTPASVRGLRRTPKR